MDGAVPRARVLGVLLSAVFVSMLCVTIVNVALPSLQRELGATAADVQWVLAGYSLSYGVLLIPSGRAGDLFGHARVFLLGLALFTAASILATLAPDPLVLNAARVVMGVGAGLFNPQVVGIIQRLYAGADRAAAFGSYGAVTAVGAAFGPVIGGALLTWLPASLAWRATFAINVPLGAVAVMLALWWLPRSELQAPIRSGRARVTRPDLDPVGVVLLAVATACLLIPFIVGSWWLLAAAVAAGASFVAWERRYAARRRSPMVDLALFAVPSFRTGVLVFSLFFTGAINVYVIQTMFVQQGLGGSALLSGLVSLPPALVTGWASGRAAPLVVRHGARVVGWGLILALVGLGATIAVMFPVAAGASIWWNALTMSVFGVGMGLVMSATQTQALLDVPVSSGGTAGGILQTGQRIGSAIGLAIVPGIWFATQAQGPARAHGCAYAAIAGFVVLALVATLLPPNAGNASTLRPRVDGSGSRL
ncbi:MAG: MFS transporter [Tetrasphaera sp.]